MRLLGDIAERLEFANTAAEIEQVLQPLVENSQWSQVLVGTFVEMAASDPSFAPPLRSFRQGPFSGLVLFRNKKAKISITTTDPLRLSEINRFPLGFDGRTSLYKFVRSGQARIALWRIMGRKVNGLPILCRKPRTRLLRDGDFLRVDGRSETFALEHSKGPILALHAEITVDMAAVQFECTYSGECVGCYATDQASSRVQLLSTFLRAQNRADAIGAMRPYFRHKDFFVRWHVMREALALDARAVLNDLSKMAATDPHEELRQISGRTLARILPAVRHDEVRDA